ncbi:MAG: aldo/keto reductase [Variovorax paradoxus]|uniref:Aldo/keto reductase n=1 Tax=Variovorax paradoxus TaxID=34073 RepID=A0A2W5SK27_VARPD|nr:MAG: aldo/keto reductase [Variovorax paradoxus]
MPKLGLGTWHMGEDVSRRGAEVAAVREAVDLGYRLIDTAEMYGEGGAEAVVGAALAEALRAGDVRRDELVVVSKVYPHNATRRGMPDACARSLERLGLERIDLYLLHWRGAVPLAETVEALQDLQARGDIGRWGVSNFDVDDMEELWALEGGADCAANQVYYSLGERGPAHSLLPWLQARGLPLMAYSPIDQGAIARDAQLAARAAELGLTAAQLALAWLAAQPGVVPIPKAVRSAHLRENLAAVERTLDEATRAMLAERYPLPSRKTPLAII